MWDGCQMGALTCFVCRWYTYRQTCDAEGKDGESSEEGEAHLPGWFEWVGQRRLGE
jgi:hypothetical protein